MPERIYIAGQYPRKDELKIAAEKLMDAGFSITSNWLYEEYSPTVTLAEVPSATLTMLANADLTEIELSDIFLFFSESPEVGVPRGGRHVEFGYALGGLKKIIVIGEKENVFHYTEGIKHFESVEEVVAYLKSDLRDKQ